jgi:hypothetical protein
MVATKDIYGRVGTFMVDIEDAAVAALISTIRCSNNKLQNLFARTLRPIRDIYGWFSSTFKTPD